MADFSSADAAFPRQAWLAIERAEADREEAVGRYLRLCGWQHTAENATQIWLWQKQLPDGRTLLCDESTALRIQQNTDALALNPSEGLLHG